MATPVCSSQLSSQPNLPPGYIFLPASQSEQGVDTYLCSACQHYSSDLFSLNAVSYIFHYFTLRYLLPSDKSSLLVPLECHAPLVDFLVFNHIKTKMRSLQAVGHIGVAILTACQAFKKFVTPAINVCKLKGPNSLHIL